MLRQRILGIALVCCFATAFAALTGCPGDDAEDPADADSGSVSVAPENICERFTTSGAPCSPVSSAVCFKMCENGGCQCVQGPEGKGVWECTSDFSCLPDAAPEGDGAPDFNDGSTFFDAGDGGDAGDSAPDDGGDGGDADSG